MKSCMETPVFAAISMIRLRLCVRETVLYKENVYLCDAVKSPFILGIIKPRIYLSSVLSENEMDYIIAHEKAHLRRMDHHRCCGHLASCFCVFIGSILFAGLLISCYVKT